MPALHLIVAQQQGPLAGMRSFLDSTAKIKLPPVVAKRKAITSKRSDEARVAAYCEAFGLNSGKRTKGATIRKAAEVVETASAETRVIEAVDGRRFLLVDGTLTEIKGEVKPEVVVEEPAFAGITKGDAWLSLGGDPQYEPNDPDAPANGGVLHRLNTLGLLGIIGEVES